MTYQTMSRNYAVLHTNQMQQAPAEDPVSLETLKPIAQNGRQTISYLRLSNNKPTMMVYYDTRSAYDTFITHAEQREPETRLPLNPAFAARIRLYHEAITTLTPEELNLSVEQPTEELKRIVDQQKQDMFRRYLLGQCTDREKLILKIAFFIDDTDMLQSDTREVATGKLAISPTGTWFLRKSSIGDTNIITTRAISIHCSTGIKHVSIVQICGYGYMISPTFPEQKVKAQVASLGTAVCIPTGSVVHPSFIDAIEALVRNNTIILSNMMGLPASAAVDVPRTYGTI